MTDLIAPEIPDLLFDADRPEKNEDRFDWLVVDGQLVHAPAVWVWACPKCGKSGPMPEDPLAPVHGSQHATSPFAEVVQINVDVVRPALGETLPWEHHD